TLLACSATGTSATSSASAHYSSDSPTISTRPRPNGSQPVTRPVLCWRKGTTDVRHRGSHPHDARRRAVAQADHDDPAGAVARHVSGRARSDDRVDGDPNDR